MLFEHRSHVEALRSLDHDSFVQNTHISEQSLPHLACSERRICRWFAYSPQGLNADAAASRLHGKLLMLLMSVAFVILMCVESAIHLHKSAPPRCMVKYPRN